MEYRKEPLPSDMAKPIRSMDVIFLWGNDGWCYIPALKARQKFTESRYFYEFWEGVIPIPKHTETLTWALYSERPHVWREGDELFTTAR